MMMIMVIMMMMMMMRTRTPPQPAPSATTGAARWNARATAIDDLSAASCGRECRRAVAAADAARSVRATSDRVVIT